MLTFKEWVEQNKPLVDEMTKMLSQHNELLEYITPRESRKPPSIWQRLKSKIGWRFISIGMRLLGDDAPYME